MSLGILLYIYKSKNIYEIKTYTMNWRSHDYFLNLLKTAIISYTEKLLINKSR